MIMLASRASTVSGNSGNSGGGKGSYSQVLASTALYSPQPSELNGMNGMNGMATFVKLLTGGKTLNEALADAKAKRLARGGGGEGGGGSQRRGLAALLPDPSYVRSGSSYNSVAAFASSSIRRRPSGAAMVVGSWAGSAVGTLKLSSTAATLRARVPTSSSPFAASQGGSVGVGLQLQPKVAKLQTSISQQW